ncbi:MAG: allantoinase [Alphaproteobacteria bacterium]|nr:allantoinase [Alphaproteobacteria bacterium]
MELIDQDVPGPRRDYVGYGRQAPRVRWPDGARVALSLVLNYEEGSEASIPAGDGYSEGGMAELAWSLPREIRDLAAESVYEYGSRAGVWRIQRIVDAAKTPITVYASAVALERNREVAAWIREASHEACAHGWRWEQVWRLTRDEEKRRIQAAVDSIASTVGERPKGWASRYNPSIHTRELLREVGGFLYDSDAFNDDLPYYTPVAGTPFLVVPYSLVHNDARFVIPQGHPDADSFLTLAKRGLDLLWDEGATHPKMMSVGLHARHIGQPGRASALREFIDYAQAKGKVWFARRIDIAQWWQAHHHEFTS